MYVRQPEVAVSGWFWNVQNQNVLGGALYPLQISKRSEICKVEESFVLCLAPPEQLTVRDKRDYPPAAIRTNAAAEAALGASGW